MSKAKRFDALVVGAGVGGLYALYRLRDKLGLNVQVLEAGDDVGGTWYWNRYPGCRCDVESLEYSFSFDPDLEQEWNWPERYGNQPEILSYVQHVADRFDLRRNVQFSTRVNHATYDRDTNLWTLETAAGEVFQAPVCIMATGNLSIPRVPDFPGLDDFQGETYHTGLWPHEGVDFTGKRVGVIGTGSSGVQSIPIIAQQAADLTVFQRTANFILPAANGPMDKAKEAEHKATYRQRRDAAWDTPFGIAGYPPPTQSALDVPKAERDRLYEAKWQEGGSISFLYTFTDLLTSDEANATARDFVHDKIRSIVTDPETAELLCAKDHPMGTKRLVLDTGYYETYNLPHVHLVNVREAPIVSLTEKGLRLEDGREFELDAIVFATGFDAMTGALKEIDIQTSDGRTLNKDWEAGPYTMLGIMCAGFPNMFMITGPGSPGVKSQMILSCEQHVDWIVDCLQHMKDHGQAAIEPTEDAQYDWTMHVKQVADATLYPKAASWYMGANIPGKPRVFMPYVGGVNAYKQKCEEVVAKGYEGFTFTPASNLKPALAMAGDD
ncbi:MAG: NAD(P)/FAD-dependent oxidoreductase [Alphaproteobacteria bacterium]|nr:NAD(P)/FAD-dependent oxidoreductase [Alphaproteobacteria bacterium]MCB9927927.1 NAD(P)/FAD-dependent oxidoreductase [Alphaproteobacteria bacterium]